jgi:hypothetical protein
MATQSLSHLRETAAVLLLNGKNLNRLKRKRLDSKLLDVSFRYGIFRTATLLGSMEKTQALVGKRRFKALMPAFARCTGA